MAPSSFFSPVVAVAAAALLHSAHAGAVVQRDATTNCSAAHIPIPVVFGATITSLTAAPIANYSGLGVNVCQVNITLTHPGANDTVNNQMLLPMTTWNGRFQGVGGGGYGAGFWASLIPAALSGYSCITTDAGHTNSPLAALDASSWALASTGNVNQYLLLNFGYRSYHDMTLIGKAVTQSYYGTPAAYSYWNGCSTGGRQGLVEAQIYPGDYDGILAEAPAIQWNDFTPAQQWPFVVMNNEGYVPLPCEFDAVDAAVIAACDGLDGLVDGIISAPALCNFDPQTIVGQTYHCALDNKTRSYQAKTATIVQKIWQGPRTPQGQWLWYGLTKGTNLTTLATTTVAANGSTIAVAFEISDSWFRDFLYKDLTYNTANITYTEFVRLFHQGHQEYDSTLGTMSPDLSAFKAHGGKMISWQGLADNFIMPQGNMYYYQKVAALDPFVESFYRQFYSPGVGHCGGGTGLIPNNALNQLRAWVENGTAPITLTATSLYPANSTSSYASNGTVARSENLCPYPMVSKYVSGNPNLAASYACASHTGFESFGTPGYLPYF